MEFFGVLLLLLLLFVFVLLGTGKDNIVLDSRELTIFSLVEDPMENYACFLRHKSSILRGIGVVTSVLRQTRGQISLFIVPNFSPK